MPSVFDYIFNIGGNFTAQINGMSQAAGDFSAQIETAQSKVGSLITALAKFDLIKSAFEGVSNGIVQFSSAGVKLDSQMHDLSAVAGVTGDGLKQIETFARQSAKAFGTDAAVAVKGSHGARGFHLSEKNALRSKLRSNSSESSTRMSLRISDFNLLASSI